MSTAVQARRWTIYVCEACGEATGRHKGCDNAHRVATEVVPIDEAAVERAALALFQQIPGENNAREAARKALEAAGALA